MKKPPKTWLSYYLHDLVKISDYYIIKKSDFSFKGVNQRRLGRKLSVS
jgi:hypothetical protein